MCEQQRVQNLSREAPKCCAWQHQGGGPETRSGTVQSLKCCPCQQKRAARLPSAQTKCCAWQHQEGGPETRLGTVQSLKCCPCQQKRAARLPSAAPNALRHRPEQQKRAAGPAVLPLPAETSSQVLRLAASGGGPETRSGTVQSLKCCPCHAAPGSIKRGGPETRSGTVQPEVLPLPAETSREAPKCWGWQGRPETRSGTVQSLKCCPLPAETSREHQGGGPETRSGTVQSLKCCPCQQKRAARLPSAAPGSIKGGGPETRSGTECCAWQHQGGGAPKRARAPSRA